MFSCIYVNIKQGIKPNNKKSEFEDPHKKCGSNKTKNGSIKKTCLCMF